jgi:hypothetical protein
MLDVLFVLVNLIPLPFWFLMIVLPRREVTQRVASSYVVFLVLGALYVFTLVGAIVAGINLATSPNPPAVNFTTTTGLAAAFANPAAALVAWLHMITMDLIGGHWMYHEARRLNAPTLFTSVALLLTFLLGPLGIFVFVLWRSLVGMRQAATARTGKAQTYTTPNAV